MFKSSELTEKLDEALAQAQFEFKVAQKDQDNPFFKSKYADLASIWDACRDALAKYQIAVTQWPVHSDDNKVHLVTRVAHHGQWMTAQFSMPVSKEDPQGYKSAVTYLRRTCLEAALGIASEDDDGNHASKALNVQKPYVTSLPTAREIVNHAPKAKSTVLTQGEPPWPQPEDALPDAGPLPFQLGPEPEHPARYEIKFGKFKAREIGTIDRHELTRYIAYLKGEAEKSKKPMGRDAQEFIEYCQLMWSMGHLDEKLPF